jgi:hypothetical protein
MRGFVVYTVLRVIHIKELFLIAALLLFTGCFINWPDPPPPPPRVFYADYDRVWGAAIDTLDELGFVIVQMRKSDGYISTDKRERDNKRVKLSLRFFKDGEGIYVKITESREALIVVKKYNVEQWDYISNFEIVGKEVRKRMALKLLRLKEKLK